MSVQTTDNRPRLEMPLPPPPFDTAPTEPRGIFYPVRFRDWRAGDPKALKQDTAVLLTAEAQCETLTGEGRRIAWWYALVSLPAPGTPEHAALVRSTSPAVHVREGQKFALRLIDPDDCAETWGFRNQETAIAAAQICALFRDVLIRPRQIVMNAQDMEAGEFSIVGFIGGLLDRLVGALRHRTDPGRGASSASPAMHARFAEVAGLILLYLYFARTYKAYPNGLPQEEPEAAPELSEPGRRRVKLIRVMYQPNPDGKKTLIGREVRDAETGTVIQSNFYRLQLVELITREGWVLVEDGEEITDKKPKVTPPDA